MPTKFYLHRTTSAVGGILPATNADISTFLNPTWTPGQTNSVAATPLMTNRVMDDVISAVAQTSLAYATDNVSGAAQAQPLLRWVSPPLSAQTISAQQITIRFGFSQSNTSSGFSCNATLLVWRPSTGAIVGNLFDMPGTSPDATTSQTALSWGPLNGSAVTVQQGDVLIFELWRSGATQTMATSYTNTIFYDGTTEGSASNNAAHIQFTNNITIPTIKNITGSSPGKTTTTATASKLSMPSTALAGPVDLFN